MRVVAQCSPCTNERFLLQLRPPRGLARSLVCLLLLVASGTARAASQSVLYENDFERYRQGSWPTDWVTAGGKWAIVSDGSVAVQQSSPDLGEGSYAALTWLNYTIRAKVRCVDHGSQWGMGIVGYWQDDRNYYRLSNFGDRLHILKVRNAQTEEVAVATVAVEKDKWYSFVLSFQNGPAGLRLRGKLFPASQPEPEEWLLQAVDLSPRRPDGAAGVWVGRARCHFDQFSVAPAASRPANDPEPVYRWDFTREAAGPLSSDWFGVRGEWRIVNEGKSVLEQTRTLPGLDFNGNAFALLANWHDYTVKASLKVTGKSKTWGQGVVGYWQNEDDHYRLMGIDDTLYLARRFHGELVHLKSIPYQFDRGTVYCFKLKLQNAPDKTHLYGKVWPGTDKEPQGWTLEAEDTFDKHFVAGSVGFWSLKGTYTFDDLRVVKNE